MEAVT